MLNYILGNEKAIIAGVTSGLLSLLAQVKITGQMTTKEVVTALVTWVFVHATTWLASNSNKPPTIPPTIPPSFSQPGV